jgi:hypothetical protein
VAKSYATAVGPKEKIILFLMANDGYKYRKITKINACDRHDSNLLWSPTIEALGFPLYQQELTLHPGVSVYSVQMLKS